jgi:phage major head subunit gpT-like protein
MDEEIASQLDQDLVTDLLTQFQSHHAPGSKKSPEPPKSQLAVEIPSISNSDEYDFLPGHFDVRCIIGEATATTMEPLYRVKLRSGEIELVRAIQSHFTFT